MLKGRYDMQLLCTLLKLQGSQAICCPLQMGQQLCTLLKLQGSQAVVNLLCNRAQLCTLLKLQGSQAEAAISISDSLLCTLLKLQGSQASNCFEALTEPCHVGAWCIFYKAIYRLQAFFAIGNDTIVCIHHCINV